MGKRSALAVVAGVILALVAPLPATAEACLPAGGVIQPLQPPAGFEYRPEDLVLSGGGWGHGVGMSQYGAKGAALLGCNYFRILGTYYPGTRVTTASSYRTATVRVGLTDLAAQRATGIRITVKAETAAVGWSIAGCQSTAACAISPPLQPVGRTWWVRALRQEAGPAPLGRNAPADGAFVIVDVTDPDKAKHVEVWRGGDRFALLRAMHSGAVVRVGTSSGLVRRFRWGFTQLDSLAEGDGKMFVVQHVTSASDGSGMERYLWGLAEVPASWPAEALKAQAVAARSYALKRIGAASRQEQCRCDLYATTRDQHYTGWDREAADRASGGRWKAAVDATAGQAATYDGAVIDAFYASSHGGRSEAVKHVWGGDVAYLQAVDTSRWETAPGVNNPRQRWAVRFSPSDLATRLGLARVESFTVVSRGPGGRPTVQDSNGDGQPDGVRVIGRDASGTAVTRWLSGEGIRSKLKLNSALIEVEQQPATAPATPTSQACPPGKVPEDGFTDVPAGDVHEPAIDCMVWWGIAAGRDATHYDPFTRVRRDQMAGFLARMLAKAGYPLAASPRDHFVDDQDSVHEHAINQLAEAGLVEGTSRVPPRFAPLESVRREQMATFLVRAYEAASRRELPAGEDRFSDDERSAHETAINQAAAAGFVSGKTPTRYEPAAPVERRQMASFIARVLNRLVNDGVTAPPGG